MQKEFIPGEMQPEGSLPEKIAQMPCPKGPITMENEAGYLNFTNFLQIALSMRKNGAGSGSKELTGWQQTNSEGFRSAFESIITEDPLFFDGFTNIGDIPEEKWKRLEDEIYA